MLKTIYAEYTSVRDFDAHEKQLCVQAMLDGIESCRLGLGLPVFNPRDPWSGWAIEGYILAFCDPKNVYAGPHCAAGSHLTRLLSQARREKFRTKEW